MRLATLALAFVATANAQPPQTPPMWATVTYIKVPGDKMAQYEDTVTNMYGKMMQARIAAGEVSRYVSTRMIMPTGSEAKYNYVSAVVQTGIPTLDRAPADLEKDWTRAGLKRAAYIDRMNTLGATIVKRELWRNIELMGTVETGDFIRFDLKKVSKAADYVNLERTLHKPYWTERAKLGALKGWALYSVALPGGEDRPYSFVTIQWFKDEGQMYGRAPAPPAESWKVAAPGKDPYQIYRDTAAVSHTAATELGRVRMVLR